MSEDVEWEWELPRYGPQRAVGIAFTAFGGTAALVADDAWRVIVGAFIALTGLLILFRRRVLTRRLEEERRDE